jgi:hypothetical protein
MSRLNAAFEELKELSEDDGLDERQEIKSVKLTLQKNIKANGDALKTAKDSFFQQFRFHHHPVALNPQTLLDVKKNAQNSDPNLKSYGGLGAFRHVRQVLLSGLGVSMDPLLEPHCFKG